MPRQVTPGVLLAIAASAFAQDRQAPLRPLPADEWDRAAAAHLLRRAGFYGTPAEIDQLATMGLEQAVRWLVDYQEIPFAIAPPPVPDELRFGIDRRALRGLTEQERREQRERWRRMQREAFEETRLWWLERMLVSPRPLEEKMTLFWHGHFTSGMREVRDAVFLLEQNAFLRRHALGNFQDLLEGISRDRAMLTYLDGRNNHKDHPNENYARELMELFTLGVGNYTEADVRAAARAFTGWTFDRFGFLFRPGDHDDGPKQFLKRHGNFNGDDILRIILEQPACSRFLARKLLTFFVRPDPDRRLVEALARELRRNDYELRPTLRTLFMSQAFYAPAARGSLIKSPVELLVSTARMFGVRVSDLRLAERATAAMGQELMQPPNVKGWPGGTAWVNTATLFTRYNTAAALILGTGGRSPDENGERDRRSAAATGQAPAGSLPARSRLHGERQPPFDPMPWVRERGLANAEQIVDFFVGHMLAVPLPESKRAALIAYLRGGRPHFDPDGRRAAARLRMMLALIASTPEFQLY